MRPHSVTALLVALAAALTLAAAPTRARAAPVTGVPGPGLVLTVLGVLTLNVATDVGIAGSLMTTGHVPLWISVPGLAVSNLNTAASVGSLALSVVGLVRRPLAVSVAPTVLEGGHGPRVPARVLSGHL